MSTFSRDPETLRALTSQQYRVTQQNATERPRCGTDLENYEPGPGRHEDVQ